MSRHQTFLSSPQLSLFLGLSFIPSFRHHCIHLGNDRKLSGDDFDSFPPFLPSLAFSLPEMRGHLSLSVSTLSPTFSPSSPFATTKKLDAKKPGKMNAARSKEVRPNGAAATSFRAIPEKMSEAPLETERRKGKKGLLRKKDASVPRLPSCWLAQKNDYFWQQAKKTSISLLLLLLSLSERRKSLRRWRGSMCKRISTREKGTPKDTDVRGPLKRERTSESGRRERAIWWAKVII